MKATVNYLEKRLGLKVNPDKTGIKNVKKNPTEFLGISIKAELKGKKWVVQSHMLRKAKHKVSKDLKAQARKIQHSTGAKRKAAALKLSTMIIGTQNYYRMATHISEDMGWITYQVERIIRCRCQPVKVRGNKIAKWMRERYGKDRWYYAIDGAIPIPPIHLVQCKPPMHYSKKEETQKGRSADKEIRKMINSFTQGSIEYLNNKISRYQAQKGKCAITGEFLEAHHAHAHHKLPKAANGGDDYTNIIILGMDVHRLVHATKPETISMYLNNLSLTPKSLQKLNKLRELAGNYKLMTA